MWQRKQRRPPSTYEDVRLVAEVLSRINAGLIERHFVVSADTARQYVERLVTERLFHDLQPDGWHYPPVRKLRLRRSPRKPKANRQFNHDKSIPDKPVSVEDLTQRIDDLEREAHTLRATVTRLQDAGKTVIGQREEWKSRAVAAEGLLEAEGDRAAKDYNRFDALRRLIAKDLHPDFCNGGDIEKLIRAECFKKLWPEIQRLAEQRD
jgi:hypothetical protein